jgi:3-deoxy-7-phosphoheptulonate synthase
VIDCSHANSDKDPSRQPEVAHAVAEQVAAGSHSLVGVMIESFLEEGRQDVKPGVPPVFGQSITDACLGWERTVPTLRELAAAARERRKLSRDGS